MHKILQINLFKCLTLLIFIIGLSTNYGKAQKTEKKQIENLQSLRSGVRILGITGNIRWRTYYLPAVGGGIEEKYQTEFKVDFRNIRMLGSHLGLGYKFFSTVFMSGFFEGGGLGGGGVGPVARYYPLKTSRWQPYLQGSLAAGFNLALSDAQDINDVGGFRFRSGLRGGLGYRISNALGLFLGIGPTWEYGQGFHLDSRALQIDLGIELYQF